MDNPCDGRGMCFVESEGDEDGGAYMSPHPKRPYEDRDAFAKRKGSTCYCIPFPCPNVEFCGRIVPEWLLECHGGYCPGCRILGLGKASYVHGRNICPVCMDEVEMRCRWWRVRGGRSPILPPPTWSCVGSLASSGDRLCLADSERSERTYWERVAGACVD